MKKTFKIEGMSCQHCVRRVKNALEEIKGIRSADVSIGTVMIEYDESSVDETIIKDAIIKAGYRISA